MKNTSNFDSIILGINRFRLWVVLFPCLFLYLVSDKSIKLMLLIPLGWVISDLAINIRCYTKVLDFEKFVAFSMYCVLASLSTMTGAIFGDQKILFRDFFIIGTALALFLFPAKGVDAPRILFTCFCASYAFTLMRNNLSFAKLKESFTANLFLPGTAATENDFGIVFGLFSVHFLLLKSWRWFLPSMMVSLMVSKRALVLGLIMSAVWWFLIGRNEKVTRLRKTVSLATIYLSLMVFSLFMIDLAEITLRVFGIEHMNVGRFLMGRNNLITQLQSQFDWLALTSIFGHGPGAADTYLAYTGTWFGGPISDVPFNPHNDYMKIIFDYGVFGLLSFFFLLHSFYGGTNRGMALMVYTITVFCFDNSLIFMIFHVVAGFMTTYYQEISDNAK